MFYTAVRILKKFPSYPAISIIVNNIYNITVDTGSNVTYALPSCLITVSLCYRRCVHYVFFVLFVTIKNLTQRASSECTKAAELTRNNLQVAVRQAATMKIVEQNYRMHKTCLRYLLAQPIAAVEVCDATGAE